MVFIVNYKDILYGLLKNISTYYMLNMRNIVSIRGNIINQY